MSKVGELQQTVKTILRRLYERKKTDARTKSIEVFEVSRRYVPIFELMAWGLKNYITEIKRILPRLAEQGLVESDFRGKKYKSWRIKK